MAAEREDRLEPSANGARRTEVVLAGAGLSNSEIAALLDKKPDTVKKTIQRARQATKDKPTGKGKP